MGRLKFKGKVKRVTCCITLPRELISRMQVQADSRVLSVSALVEICLLSSENIPFLETRPDVPEYPESGVGCNEYEDHPFIEKSNG